MKPPNLEIIPARKAVRAEEPVVLDVLLRITPALPEVHFPRPQLNLALVLDRSGSMAEGKKMSHASAAAAYVVEQLLPEDLVSVTVFDEVVEPIVPSTKAADKPGIVAKIQKVRPRGSTDLHSGWAEGGRQATSALLTQGINRVFLLSDGQANAGVTDPNTITVEAKGLAANGVGTTTLGVGDNFNEDLMESLASAGDGHYYYIETPDQLMDIFQTELQGLLATSGVKVSLGLEGGEGVAIVDVLNDFEKVSTGRFKLPNLIVGMPILVIVRLKVPAQSRPATLLNVRLAWDDPRDSTRQSLHARLEGLPSVDQSAWVSLPQAADVAEQSALLMAARAQKEAALAQERGDLSGTHEALNLAYSQLSSVPGSPTTLAEIEAIAAMRTALDHNESAAMIKMAKFHSYGRRHGRSAPPTTES